MNRNVPTKEGSEASFRFIVLRVCEVLKAIWAKRSEAANTLLTAVAVPGLICQEGKMRRFLSTATKYRLRLRRKQQYVLGLWR